MLTISIRDGETYYSARVPVSWAARHNNDALVSIGLTVGKDLTPAAFAALKRNPNAKVEDVSQEKYQHSGCQSSCILRGASQCRW